MLNEQTAMIHQSYPYYLYVFGWGRVQEVVPREFIAHPAFSTINTLSETNSLCVENGQCKYSLILIQAGKCGHVQFHYENLVSPLVLRNQI